MNKPKTLFCLLDDATFFILTKISQQEQLEQVNLDR